jgi:hypothetical protein
MDETYIKVKGKWVYLYRAVDSHGDTLDFMLSERRDEDAATAFFKQAINNNGFPDKVVMDKSGANYAGLANINLLLIFHDLFKVAIRNAVPDIKENRIKNNVFGKVCSFKADHNFILCTLGNKRGIISEFIHKCDRNPAISLCLRQNRQQWVQPHYCQRRTHPS